ncbi:MAG: hypothetical protein DRR03_03170 [Gammaproteobacteria bacterium]|nr:MAG: hypothetical protein DRR03_03170 [Gammaproteobacteria bacterium]
MESTLVCWRCGEPLHDDLPRLFPRLEKCLACDSDLHVCRMCRFYAPQYTTNCSHDRAEPARETDIANFCSHFRLRHGAHDGTGGGERTRDDLDALFDGDAEEAGEPGMADNSSNDEPTPMDDLNSLFGDDTGGGDKAG